MNIVFLGANFGKFYFKIVLTQKDFICNKIYQQIEVTEIAATNDYKLILYINSDDNVTVT